MGDKLKEHEQRKVHTACCCYSSYLSLLILPKPTYKFNVILMENAGRDFVEIDKLILKFLLKVKSQE